MNVNNNFLCTSCSVSWYRRLCHSLLRSEHYSTMRTTKPLSTQRNTKEILREPFILRALSGSKKIFDNMN